MRRSLAVLAIVLAGPAGTIATAAAATPDAAIPVVVTVYAPGQPPVTEGTTIGALEQGCPTSSVDPTLYGAGGAAEPGTQPSVQEWALSTLLSSTAPACLPTPIPISAVSQVTVLGSNGQPDLNAAAELTPPDLTLPSDFADSTQWPVFWDAGSAVIYERPSRSTGDDNAADQVIAVPGQSLQFDVFEDTTPVAVTVSASATSVSAGGIVSFTASLAGTSATSGAETFAWNFDGAAPAASGSSVSATFATAGVYEVTVQATGASDGFGQIEVNVGSTPPGTGTATTPTGPVNGSGTTPGATVPKKPGPRPRHKPTGASPTTTTSVTATGDQSASSVPTVTPSTTVNIGTSTRAAGGGGGGRAGGGRGGGHGGTGSGVTPAGVKVSAAKKARPKVNGPPASGPAATARRAHTVVVQGRLLDSVGVAAGGGASGQAGSSQAPAVNRAASGWPWAAILAGLAVVALLGLGAGRELRLIRWAP